MPALPELQSEALKWQRRISMLSGAGFNPAPATELARTDLSRLAQGGAPLPEEQIVSMVHSAYTGNVSTPKSSGGTDWNPLHILGDVGKDLTTDVRSFVPGLIHEGMDIVNPQKWSALEKGVTGFQFGSISDMAKEVQALPILGPLVPGMFALSAGTSGITQHPLNFMLDVAAVASVGTKLASLPLDAADSEVNAALKEGHPVRAVARATGLESKLMDALDQAGASPYIKDIAKQGHYSAAAGLGLTPLKDSQWAYMPVWRAYNALARLETRRLRDNGLKHLDKILPQGLSDEEKAQMVTDAQTFDDRYLAPASPPNLQQIANAGGDVRNAFAGINGDVRAYTTVDPSTDLPTQLAFTPQEAERDLQDPSLPSFVPPEARDKFPVQEVRVNVGNITFNPQTGRYIGEKILPNKFFTHEQEKVFKDIREFVNTIDVRKLARDDSAPEAIILPTGVVGPEINELYARDSIPWRAQINYHEKVKEFADASKARASAQEAVTRAKQKVGKLVAKHPKGEPYSAAIRAAYKQVADAEKRLQIRASTEAAAKNVRDDALDKFHKSLMENPTGRWSTLVTNMVRGRLKEDVRGKLHGQGARVAINGQGIKAGLDEAKDAYVQLTGIENAKSAEEMSAVVGAETFNRVQKDALSDWTQLVAAGYDPIFIHHIDPKFYYDKTFASIKPLAHDMQTVDRGVVFDFSPQVLDIHAQLTEQAMNFFQTEATRQFVDFMANKSGMIYKTTDLRADLQRRFPNQPEIAEHELSANYVKWSNPHDPEHEYVVPRRIEKGLLTVIEGDRLPLRAIRQPVHRIFKVSVLSGPRHFVHVALGGLVQVALEEPGALTELEVLAHPVAMFRAMRDGVVPAELSKWHDQLTTAIQEGQLVKGQYEETATQLVAYRGGGKLAQWWRQSMIGRGLHSTESHINNIENSITDMYRAAVYIHKLRGKADNEAALATVNKILIDVDNMTPFERGALRQVFPFWTFTKHILRYVLTYPADHPLRASILAHLAQGIEDDQRSGDPARLSKLFFLGTPDMSGNVKTLDFSNLNPFRSMSSVFSMAGFLSGLSPEFQVLLQSYGLNTLTGTPTLHPNMTYDQYSGKNVATRPPFNPVNYISDFIPQAEIVDHFVQFTDTMRYLAKNDEEAYYRSLWTEMNLPFTIQPINIYDIRAKSAADQYKFASTAVSDAMRTGNTDPLRSFMVVPFEGALYPGDQIANYIDNFDKLYPGIAPRAIVRKPRRRKTQL